MIERFSDKILLDFDENINCFTLYSYDRIVIHPNTDLFVGLPYFRKNTDSGKINKFIYCELHEQLIHKNLSIMWNNLNKQESFSNLSFLLKNNNIILREDLTELTTITGTHKKIDIPPNKPIIRVFIN